MTDKGKYPLFILYGSATGNSEHIAKELAVQFTNTYLASNGVFDSVLCLEADQFKKKCLPIWEQEPSPDAPLTKYGLIVIASTTGNGEAPENCSRFVRYIKHKNTPKTVLQYCNYAVLGLGDTNYDHYCENGKIIDRKLHDLGATRLQPIACADEGTGTLEDTVDPWVATIVQNIINACRRNATTSTDGPSAEPSSAKNEDVITNGTTLPLLDEQQPVIENGSIPSVTTTPVIPDIMAATGPLSVGAQIVKSLLLQNPEQTSSLVLETHSGALSALNLTKCEILTEEQFKERIQASKSHSNISGHTDVIDDEEDATTSYYYNMHHPYESTISNARYLTTTRLPGPVDEEATTDNGAKSVLGTKYTALDTVDGWNTISKFVDDSFPLEETETNDANSHNCALNSKRVIELTLSLPGDESKWSYQPGDALGLIVSNPPDVVSYVRSILPPLSDESSKWYVSIDTQRPIPYDEALKEKIDFSTHLHAIHMKRILLGLSDLATDPYEKYSLQLLGSKTDVGKSLYTTFVTEQRLSVVSLLQLFPSTHSNRQLTLAWFVNFVPAISPRYYSITSSPLPTNTKQVTIAFSVVDYITPSLQYNTSKGEQRTEFGSRRIHGLATRFFELVSIPFLLGDGKINVDAVSSCKLRIFPKPTPEFRLPSSLSTPIILIGPGTGVAPFIGFLQHRQELLKQREQQPGVISNDELIGSVDLYFGCRHSNHDWLYKDEMNAYKADGIVTNLQTAFSRDDASKKQYVQHLLKHDSCCHRFLDLILNQNAIVYICGDGNQMAKDVQICVVDLLYNYLKNNEPNETSGNKEPDDIILHRAQEYLTTMKLERRFLLDIWS